VAVDLFNLVEPLKREVQPPGSDLFPDSTDDDWLGSLTDAFWEVRLYGFLYGYEENASARGGDPAFGEGIVTPHGVEATYDDPTGWSDEDLSRELQQLVVLWAGWKIVLTRMSALQTLFRAQAGPVEYETQYAASVLKNVLDQLKARIDWVIGNLRPGNASAVTVFDQVIERTYAVATGELWWVK